MSHNVNNRKAEWYLFAVPLPEVSHKDRTEMTMIQYDVIVNKVFQFIIKKQTRSETIILDYRGKRAYCSQGRIINTVLYIYTRELQQSCNVYVHLAIKWHPTRKSQQWTWILLFSYFHNIYKGHIR